MDELPIAINVHFNDKASYCRSGSKYSVLPNHNLFGPILQLLPYPDKNHHDKEGGHLQPIRLSITGCENIIIEKYET